MDKEGTREKKRKLVSIDHLWTICTRALNMKSTYKTTGTKQNKRYSIKDCNLLSSKEI